MIFPVGIQNPGAIIRKSRQDSGVFVARGLHLYLKLTEMPPEIKTSCGKINSAGLFEKHGIH
jgi:hypothetical protein